ncbi:phosphopentomutase [Thermicanus aegyptius]|uniref:phosphopentomutase n=1 Tax=Thermicanus aegyptius TaxID=94009 RepID=UPI0004266CF8|nr:phosphopentomutase [Thermicanus aegyptius]
MRFSRIFCIVLDSVGIGALPDAKEYGDEGVNTLGHIASEVGLSLPHLARLGLGNIAPIEGIPPVSTPAAHFGKMAEASVGKDTTTGHWELMGLKVEIPFKTYPNGFPKELIQQFEKETGRKVIGNKPASGTVIIEELGKEQLKTGAWIVYTSADSVFQIAAHEEVIPLEELYRGCEIARRLTLQPEFAVARVIARPYIGQPGSFQRTPHRRDFSVKPPQPTVMNRLLVGGYAVLSIGKISDIFAGEGISESIHTTSNQDGVNATLKAMEKDFEGFSFTNLVDFDSKYGHRRDPLGYKKALEEFDARLPELLDGLHPGDLLIITADHGNDPTHSGTDHTREYVPILLYHKGIEKGENMGIRSTFSDVAATIADNFNIERPDHGESFLHQL